MRHLPVVLALATLAAGCDAQFSPKYTGESLLTIVGNVEISDNQTKGRIVPALAFLNESQGEVSIQEVAVHGRFPSDFRLDVFEPPPDDAFVNLTHQKTGEPNVAVGYITAVSAKHPENIRYGTHTTTTAFACGVETACDQPCGEKGCLVLRTEVCIDADPSVPCYTEETYCPTFDTPIEECVVRPIGGDPGLNESPWQTFAGFSQNYIVVYLRDRADSGSVTSAILGSTDGVPAGYGLYAVRVPTEADFAASQECTSQAEIQAATAWNEEFDANLTTLNFDVVCAPMAKGEFSGFAAPFCGADQEHLLDEANEARVRLIEAAKLELGCPIFDARLERVEDPATESVSVVIGREVQPIFVQH